MFLCGVMSSPHTTSLPLNLIEVLYPILKDFKSGSYGAIQESLAPALDAKERGMLYIVLNSIFSNIWRWTVFYNLIQPKNISKAEIFKVNQNEDLKVNLLEHNFLRADKFQKLRDENLRIENENYESYDIINNQNKHKDKTEKFGCWNVFKEILNTPIIISILSICLCINNNIKLAFINKGSILADNLFSVNSIIARCYNFTVIFILGLNFANISFFNEKNKKNKFKDAENNEVLFSNWKIFIISVMKLLIFPLIGCPVIFYFRSMQFITDDILVFLFMFMLAAPNAINIIIVCSVKRSWLKNISLIVMVTYVISLVTLTFAITMFLYILSSY